MTWTTKLDYKTNKQVEATCGEFRLRIHHYIGCGDTWFFSVHPGPFDMTELKAKKLNDAKQESAELFRKCLSDAMLALEE